LTIIPASVSRFLTNRSIIWHSALALLAALLLILSYPPFEVSHLIWIALLPLLIVVGNGISRRRAFCSDG